MRFYLGTHKPHWLARTDTPLFISRNTLCDRKKFPRAQGRWALDSGGFTELKKYGRWTLEPKDYVDEVRRYQREIGGMDWAAIQDWMCEPEQLKNTGLTVKDHQLLTVMSYCDLRWLAPEVPWVPVVQGWTRRQYMDHVELYARHDVYLQDMPLVGIGSVCRRQNMINAQLLIDTLYHDAGLRSLHGFGFKLSGLTMLEEMHKIFESGVLASADSMAWSIDARRGKPLPDCSHGESGQGKCSNCFYYAMTWRNHLLEQVRLAAGEGSQPLLV